MLGTAKNVNINYPCKCILMPPSSIYNIIQIHPVHKTPTINRKLLLSVSMSPILCLLNAYLHFVPWLYA